jgi:hypothetical protein
MLNAGVSLFVTCAYQPANVNCQILVPECDRLFVSSDRALLSHEVIVMIIYCNLTRAFSNLSFFISSNCVTGIVVY